MKYWMSCLLFLLCCCGLAQAVPNENHLDPELIGEKWSVSSEFKLAEHTLAAGQPIYTDRDYTFTEIPDVLKGASYVLTRMASKGIAPDVEQCQLVLKKKADVWVGFDHRATQLPAWLKSWEKVPGQVLGEGKCNFTLCKKTFSAGEVILYGNRAPASAAMYTVFISAPGVDIASVKQHAAGVVVRPLKITKPVFNHAPQFNEFFTPEMEEAVEAVLQQMTAEEKMKLVNGDVEGRGPKHRGSATIDRLGIGTMVFYNGPRGFQVGRKSTLFPCGTGQAAAFDPANTEKIGGAIASEFLESGWEVLEAPSMNIIRDSLNGRNFEYYTEDPFLNGKLTAGFVIGGQRAGAVTTAKHFIANNKETNRGQVNAVVGDRALREIYLPGFKEACRVGVFSLMTGANRCNGPHASANPDLISILKNEWNWPGFLYTDWNGSQDSHKAINAGLDLSMPGKPNGAFGFDQLKKEYDAGLFDEEVLTDKARRILRSVYFAGKLERGLKREPKKADREKNHQLAYQMALDSMTLVKNENKTLPITDADKRIAVLGPMASKKFTQQTGGSSGVGSPAYDITAAEGMKKRFGDRVEHVPFSMDDVFQVVGSPFIYHKNQAGEKVDGFEAIYSGKDPIEGKPASFSRADTQIEFNWEMASPDREVLRPSDFLVTWKGNLVSPSSGEYTLQLVGTQNVKVFLDGKQVIHKRSRFRRMEVTLQLQEGKEYELKMTYKKERPTSDCWVRLGWIRPDTRSTLQSIFQHSIDAAKKADVAVVFIGLDHNTESEGMDRDSMRLPEYHEEFVKAILAANPRTAVVVYAGTPIAMDPWFETTPALVLPWHPGIENGNAVATVLAGDADFGGRLPITFPKSYADSPAHPSRQQPDKFNTIIHHEGIFVGYRWYDYLDIEPLIPFGHGLSYSPIEFSNLKLSAKDRKNGQPVSVSFEVENLGALETVAIPQLYVKDVESSLPRPPKELKGFDRIRLKSGETKTVTMELDDSSFAFYDPAKRAWVVETGEFEILIGASSRNIVLTEKLIQK